MQREWYDGWNKAAEHASAFDSNTGEFAFAQLADQSDGVRWWLRLYRTDPVFILYGTQRYYPDFIVIDDDNVHWVVETKGDAAAANDTQVAEKRAAAEEWHSRSTLRSFSVPGAISWSPRRISQGRAIGLLSSHD